MFSYPNMHLFLSLDLLYSLVSPQNLARLNVMSIQDCHEKNLKLIEKNCIDDEGPEFERMLLKINHEISTKQQGKEERDDRKMYWRLLQKEHNEKKPWWFPLFIYCWQAQIEEKRKAQIKQWSCIQWCLFWYWCLIFLFGREGKSNHCGSLWFRIRLWFWFSSEFD